MSFPIDPAQVIRYQDFRHLNECGSNRWNIYSHRSASLLMFHVKHQPNNRQLVVMRNYSILSNENSRQVSDISSSTFESSTKSNTNNWKTNIWKSTNRYMVVANADMIKSLDHWNTDQTRSGHITWNQEFKRNGQTNTWCEGNNVHLWCAGAWGVDES